MDKKYINGFLIITLMTITGISTYTIKDTNLSSICTNGTWGYYNDTHYSCSTTNKLNICYRLSSTNKTCYIGTIYSYTAPESISSKGEYFCYEDGTCRLKGLLSNPLVKKEDIK